MSYKRYDMLNKKKVLGRGLGALIGGGDRPAVERPAVEQAPGSAYMLCPIHDITPNRTQPRKSFLDASLMELSDSIKENGIIEPLVVRKNRLDGTFELIAGERRWRAAKMAGLESVPVVVIEATDQKSLEFAIIENIQREELNAIEEAEAYRSLMGFGISQEDVARKVGKDRATVANYLRLLKLPAEVKDEMVKGSISMGHAKALLSMEGHGPQVELCKKIISKGLSVREAEALANKSSRPEREKKGGAHSPVEDEMRRIFGTKVALKDRHGKGRIEIHYFSAEERERLIDLIRGLDRH